MENEHMVVRIHANTGDLPQHEGRRELWPAVHNLIGIGRQRLRAQRRDNNNESEEGGKPNEQYHGLTVPHGSLLRIGRLPRVSALEAFPIVAGPFPDCQPERLRKGSLTCKADLSGDRTDAQARVAQQRDGP